MHLQLNTDGGSRNNPGPAASAFILRNNGEIIHQFHKAIGNATNNIAEYTALLEGLLYIQSLQKNEKIIDLSIIADSLLMIRQIEGKYKIKDQTLRGFAQKIHQILSTFTFPYTLKHVLREYNSEADTLVKKSLGL